jgi:hypothetical protein
MIEANPSVYSTGATLGDEDERRLHADCHGPQGPCDFASVGLVTNSTNSTYHAAQLALSRRFNNGLSFLTSYTFSRSCDWPGGRCPGCWIGGADRPDSASAIAGCSGLGRQTE